MDPAARRQKHLLHSDQLGWRPRSVASLPHGTERFSVTSLARGIKPGAAIKVSAARLEVVEPAVGEALEGDDVTEGVPHRVAFKAGRTLLVPTAIDAAIAPKAVVAGPAFIVCAALRTVQIARVVAFAAGGVAELTEPAVYM